jgi:hypothetical protein
MSGLFQEMSKNLFSVLAAQDRNENSRFLSTATECYLKVNGKTFTFSKKRFLVVFKDSYTKFRYSFVMKQKSDVKVVLKQF